MSLQADLLGRPVRVVDEGEAALLGVAQFAARSRHIPMRLGSFGAAPESKTYEPTMQPDERAKRRAQWSMAIQRSRAQITDQ